MIFTKVSRRIGLNPITYGQIEIELPVPSLLRTLGRNWSVLQVVPHFSGASPRLAEVVGFEPTDSSLQLEHWAPSPDLESGTFDHSDTLPWSDQPKSKAFSVQWGH